MERPGLLTAAQWVLLGSVAVWVGCGSRADRPGGPCHVPMTRGSGIGHQVEVRHELPPLFECGISGVVYEQLLWELDDDARNPTPTGPFAGAMLRKEPMVDGVLDLIHFRELCWDREHPMDALLVGDRDVGETIELEVGKDVLELKRRPNWAPGNLMYVYDRANAVGVGGTVGAEVVLAGVATGARVPQPLALDPATWTDLQQTGVLDLRWTPNPSDERTHLWILLYQYDTGYERRGVHCLLDDDGRAVVDLGMAPEVHLGSNVYIMRLAPRVIDHPEFGNTLVYPFQNNILGQPHFPPTK